MNNCLFTVKHELLPEENKKIPNDFKGKKSSHLKCTSHVMSFNKAFIAATDT